MHGRVWENTRHAYVSWEVNCIFRMTYAQCVSMACFREMTSEEKPRNLKRNNLRPRGECHSRNRIHRQCTHLRCSQRSRRIQPGPPRFHAPAGWEPRVALCAWCLDFNLFYCLGAPSTMPPGAGALSSRLRVERTFSFRGCQTVP